MKLSLLVFEVAHSGEEHRYAALIGLFDGILVAYASARLDDGLDAVLGSKLH